MRGVRCVSESNNQVVDDRYCVDEKPTNITNCGQQRCPKWRFGDWGQVSVLLYAAAFLFLFCLQHFGSFLFIFVFSVTMIVNDIVK